LPLKKVPVRFRENSIERGRQKVLSDFPKRGGNVGPVRMIPKTRKNSPKRKGL